MLDLSRVLTAFLLVIHTRGPVLNSSYSYLLHILLHCYALNKAYEADERLLLFYFGCNFGCNGTLWLVQD